MKKKADPSVAKTAPRAGDSRQSREKASRFAVLGMLSVGCKTGYDVKKAIAGSTSNFWNESYGNIYPVLKRLLAEGAIRAEKQAATGGRAKQSYSVTADGRRMLEEWLRQPVLPRPEDNEFLLKLFFGAMVEPRDARGLLKAYRAHYAAAHAKYERIEESIAADHATRAEKTYWGATLAYGEAITRAIIEWCDATDRKLQKLES
jgi:PadR family transcriptional regulator, regulatory protein AphA